MFRREYLKANQADIFINYLLMMVDDVHKNGERNRGVVVVVCLFLGYLDGAIPGPPPLSVSVFYEPPLIQALLSVPEQHPCRCGADFP